MLTSKYASTSHNPGTRSGKFYYGWVVLAVCLILITMSYGTRFSFGVFFKSLEQEFAWTRALTSGIFSVYLLLGALFAIIGGWSSDRYGPKMIFIAMGIFAFVGLLLTSQSTMLWHFFVSYSLLVAAGTGPTYAIATSVTTRWFTERRGLALAIVTSGVGIGSILMAPVAAYFIESYGWRISFAIIGTISLIVMILCSLFLKRDPSKVTISSEGKSQKAVDHKSSGEQKKEITEFSLLQAIRTRNFFVIFFIWFCYAFCLFTIMTHIVPHAIDLGISSLQAASIISVIGFANLPNRILMGIATDRFSRKPIALINALVMAGAIVLLTRSSSLWMLYVFAVVFGAAYGGLAPPTLAMIGDIFGLRHIGLIFGALEIGWVCGGALGPTLAGYIFDTTGRYNLAFILVILAALVIVALVCVLKVPAAKTEKF